MLTIRLFCNAGLSTSLLMEKVRVAAGERGIDADVAAFPVGELARCVRGADCVLLAPQAGYRLTEVGEICTEFDVPVGVIAAVDYGMVNAPRVLDLALRLTNK